MTTAQTGDGDPADHLAKKAKYFSAPLVQVEDLDSLKVHLYTEGVSTLCTKLEVGTPAKPRLNKKGMLRAAFQPSWNTIDLMGQQARVCKTCFSEANVRRYKGIVALCSHAQFRLRHLTTRLLMRILVSLLGLRMLVSRTDSDA